MNKVIIMRGIPGSGKSYKAGQLLLAAAKENHSTAVCSADAFFNKGKEYKFDPKLIGNAHIYCMSEFLKALQSSVELVIVDNTHTQVWEYTPYVQVAQCYGYEIEIVHVICDQKEAYERQTHGVPFGQHLAMANRYQQVLPHHQQFLTVIKN